MEIREFAEHLLFGTTVSDKLLDFSSEGGFTDLESQSVRFREPRFPGRPRELLNLDQQDLPSLHQLDRGDAWAQMLHYFANHELLAIELMALSLLKFPGTPEAYRRGVVHTILEEQEHLQMYINRLKKLGVEFGDFAVNDFFWKQISAASSPQEFVVLMNMTFEQANLDFSLHYKGIAAQLGDQESVSILDKIHHDEIRHVGHGVKWFNRWRKESGDLKSDWQAFLQNLPPGVSARRARGIGFCSESRLEAGLSQEFIHELEVCGGSKGRPSDLYFFNPEVDLHHLEKPLDRSALPEPFREIIADLESLPIFYMKESDVLLVEDAPRREWLHHLHSRGVQIPEIREWNFAKFKDLADESRKWGEVKPWGSSAQIQKELGILQKDIRGSLPNVEFLGQISSKLYWSKWYQDWYKANPHSSYLEDSKPPYFVSDIASLNSLPFADSKFIVKAPYGSSGRGSRMIRSVEELQKQGKWLERMFKAQKELLAEEYCERIADFSWQLNISQDKVSLVDLQQFFVGSGLQYRGAWIGSKFGILGGAELRFLHEELEGCSRFQIWQVLVESIGEQIRKMGYVGPASVDAFLYKDRDGNLQLRPVCEVNVRYTMGRVAYSLRSIVPAGKQGLWIHMPLIQCERNFGTIAQFGELCRKMCGVSPLFTTDPEVAKRLATVLVMGDKESLLKVLLKFL